MGRILRNLTPQQLKKSAETVRQICSLFGGMRATAHATGIKSFNLYNYIAGNGCIPPQYAAILYDHCLNIKTITELEDLGISRENMCPDVFHYIVDKRHA